MNIGTRQTLSVLLTIVSSLGTIATAYLAAKVTPDVIKKIELKKQELGRNLTKKELMSLVGKDYIPALLLGGATIVSNVSSAIINRKTQTSLLGMAVFADQGWRRYKGKVKDILGNDAHKKIVSALGKDEFKEKQPKQSVNPDEKLYFNDYVGFFYANPEKLALAYGDLNQRINLPDARKSFLVGIMSDFLEQAEAKSLYGEFRKDDLMWGWSMDYLIDNYEYSWVHMTYTDEIGDSNEPYIRLDFEEEPIFNPGNYGEDILIGVFDGESPGYTRQFSSVKHKKQKGDKK